VLKEDAMVVVKAVEVVDVLLVVVVVLVVEVVVEDGINEDIDNEGRVQEKVEVDSTEFEDEDTDDPVDELVASLVEDDNEVLVCVDERIMDDEVGVDDGAEMVEIELGLDELGLTVLERMDVDSLLEIVEDVDLSYN
jgi:hypothetical protein